MLMEANALLERVSGGTPLPSAMMQSIDDLQELGYVCDESGCVLVLPEPKDVDDAPPGTLDRLLQGSNWSLGMTSRDGSLPAVVGGPHWSIPLHGSELADLVRVFNQLRGAVAGLQAQGQWLPGSSERPVSRVRLDAGKIALQATFSALEPGFLVDFTFTSGSDRTFSVSWPPDVVAAAAAGLDRAAGGEAAIAPRTAAAVASV